MLPSRQKNNLKQLGFICLNSDRRGNYWFKIAKNFDHALAVSISSLEDLMDELPGDENSQKIDTINRTYRKLSGMLEEQG